MLKQRIIPSLLLKDGRMVKGKNFGSFRDVGDPVGQQGQLVAGRGVEPPFSPLVVAGRLLVPAVGPTRALHNTSLIST